MAANAQVDQVMRAKALADDFTPGFMVRLGREDEAGIRIRLSGR